MSAPAALALVTEQVQSLSAVCDLEPDVIAAFRDAMLPVAERHLATLMTASATQTLAGGAKVKLTKKGVPVKARATKPKEDKISAKNAYHIFVAAKMGEVIANGVEPKLRMTKIGEMWKAMTGDDKKPYEQQATAYNAHVTQAMATDPDWRTNQEAIKAAANAASVSSGAVSVETEAEPEAEPEVVAAPVVVTAPVVAAPVVAAPVVATKTKATKPKTK